MKPKLKPPGSKLLELEYDGLLSNFGFKFNLRLYTMRATRPDLHVRLAGRPE